MEKVSADKSGSEKAPAHAGKSLQDQVKEQRERMAAKQKQAGGRAGQDVVRKPEGTAPSTSNETSEAVRAVRLAQEKVRACEERDYA